MELVPLVMAAGFAALALLERQVFSYGPPCVLHRLTGWNCPGCGGTRAFFALVHGDPVQSLRYNPLTLIILTSVLVWLVRVGLRFVFPADRLLRPFSISSRSLWIAAGLVILFGVLRNLPWWPFTLLAPPA